MIESAQELESTLTAIEANQHEIQRLAEEYERLPSWAMIRQARNLDKRTTLLVACAPLWEKLNEGLAPGVEA